MTEGMKLESKSIGDATGMILPEELLARLRLELGDWVSVTETPEGGLMLRRVEPELGQVMGAARDVMNEYRETFRALA